MAWEIEPLIFGLGLDRYTGPMLAEPASMVDLRNVHLRDGGAELRRGLLFQLDFPGDEAVLAIHPVRSQAIGVVVTYDTGTGNVLLYSVPPDLTSKTLIGTLFTIPAAGTFPRVILADSNGKVIVTHDEPVFAQRQKTRVYDAAAATLADYTADLYQPTTPPTPVATYFRWVERYLNYVILGGYGTENAGPPDDRDRPEIVRVSLPGDTQLVAEHYFIAGQRGEPAVIGKPAGNVFLVFKETETYEIFGYDRATFGIRPADPHYGCAGSRLAVTVGGTCYFWSHEGPRRSRGGLSEDLALPLDLLGPTPDPLAPQNAVASGFVYYHPDRREVVWHFDRWAYVYHVPSGQWSFRSTGVSLNCAGILYPGTGTVAPALAPDFYADITSVTLTGVTDREATVSWNHILNAGGPAAPTAADKAEVWARPLARGTWELLVDNVALAGPTGSQVVTLPWYADLHEVAVRVKRNGVYGAAYSSGNPTDWPTISKDASCITQWTGAPTIFSNPVWSRQSASAEKVTLAYTWAGAGQTNMVMELEKDLGSGFVASGTPDQAAGATCDYQIQPGEGETQFLIRGRLKNAYRTGAFNGALNTYMGPYPPTGSALVATGLDGYYDMSWTTAIGAGETELHTGKDAGGETLYTTVQHNASPQQVFIACPATTVQCKARHKVTSFGVTDYSTFGNTQSIPADCDGMF